MDPTSQPVGAIVEGPPARRPERTRLIGRHIHIVPFDPDRHAPALYAASHGAGHEGLWTYLSVGPFPDEASFRHTYEALAAKDDPLLFALADPVSGAPLGHATYMRIEPGQRVVEVGNILFTPALARTPAATEAMYLMARHAFEDLGYRRYEWKCNALNAPSKRAAERLGFTFEGHLRKHWVIKGRQRDTDYYSITDDEWPRCRDALLAWLDASNFAPDGTARRGLAELRAALPDGTGIA